MNRERTDATKVLRALGAAIRAARIEKGYSQERFAAHAGIDRSYFGAVERGDRNVTIRTLLRISASLRVSPAELIGAAGSSRRGRARARAGLRMRSAAPTVTIPAEVASLLRESLLVQLARACEDAPGAKDEETHAGWAPILARIDGARATLDAIGWTAPPVQEPVTVALNRAIVDALEADLDHWRWTAHAAHLESVENRQQAARTADLIERFLTGLPRRSATLIVPPALIGPIAEGAEDMTHTIAQAIDNGRDLYECATRLHAVARLLDAICGEDTGGTVELDLAEYGKTLRAAVAVMLPVLERGVADMPDGDPLKREREDELRIMREFSTQVLRAIRPSELSGHTDAIAKDGDT